MTRFHLATLAVLVIGIFVFAAGAASADVCALPLLSPPPGPLTDRWFLTGGPTGPMGCGIAPVMPAPGGAGQLMNFQNGQIVTSPGQGTNMTVAAYQLGTD